MLERGEVQGLPLVGRTPERESIFDFTFPYMSLHGAIVVRTGTSGIQTLGNLRGGQVAVMRGDNAEEFLRREDRGIDIVTTESFEEALQGLASGNFDAVVIQRLVGLRLIQEHNLTSLRVLNQPIEGFRQDFCFAVREGDRETLALLNEGLALVMADGTYRRLHAKWFAAMELPSQRRIVIGGDHGFPPFEFLDQDGRPTGFNVELTRAIARETGLDIVIRLGPWADIVEALESGEIDGIQGMFYSPERDQRFDFTQASLVNHCVAAVRKGEGAPPLTAADLTGKRIVVQRGDIMHGFAVDHGFESQLTLVETQEDALRELIEGMHDCALVSRLTALYWKRHHGWDSLIVGNRPLLSPEYSYAVPNGHQALLAQLSEGMQLVAQSGEFRKIYEKWMGVYEVRTPDLLTILKYGGLVAGPLFLILILAFGWSWSLRKEVARRTEDLQKSEERLRLALAGGDLGTWDWHIPSGAVAFNERWAAMLGRSLDDLEPHLRTWESLVHPEDVPGISKALSAHLRGESSAYETEHRMLHRDGTWVWVLDRGRVIERDAAGNPIRACGTHLDVTERKRSEEALRQSEEFQRVLIACSPLPIFSLDLEGRVVTWNEAAEQTFGWTAAEVIGLPLPIVPPDLESEFLGLQERLLVEGAFSGVQVTRMTRSGERRDFSLSAAPIRDSQGGPIGIMAALEDITDRKRAEERQRRYRDMLARTERIARVGSWEWEIPNGNVTWSDEMFEIFQRNPALGAPSYEEHVDLFQPGELDRVWSAMEMAVKTGTPYELELAGVRRDGATRYYLSWGYPERGTDGHGPRMYGSLQDVTEAKLAQQRIEHMNRVLRAIRDINQLIVRERDRDALMREGCRLLVGHRGYSSALIVLTDEHDRPTSVAEAGIDNVFDVNTLLLDGGKKLPCFECVPADGTVLVIADREEVCSQCPLFRTNSALEAMSVRLVHNQLPFGYLTVTMEAGLATEVEEQNLFLGIAGDLALALHVLRMERLQLESERRSAALEDQLFQAQKMESVGRLAGGVAHDYNNMLSVIIGYAELALDKAVNDSALSADLGEILNAARRSNDITRQLLAFARKQPISPRALDLNDVVSGTLKLLRRLIGEDVDLAWLPGGNLGQIMMDPAQMDQILANLCVNARDAIAGVGKITIETDNTSIDLSYCTEHPDALPGEYVVLAVSDTGCGMDRETIQRIFEPFFTTKATGEGTGLGLATVYGIVRQNNGFINVYSETGDGSTFRLYFPRYAGTAPPEHSETSDDIPAGLGETVLIVEDEPAIMKMGRRMLERLGYQVLTANSPEEAIRIADRERNALQLLITDVVMPEMNGRALADRLNQLCPQLKTLFMSGYTANVIAHQGVLNEGVNFIQKPFSMRELACKVRTALESD